MQRKVDYHANIIKFYGIQSSICWLVMEYADGRSLESYLKENLYKLKWNDKYQLAFQLATAVACMHNEGCLINIFIIYIAYTKCTCTSEEYKAGRFWFITKDT